MIIKSLQQAKRTVIVVFSVTLLAGGGLLFHVLKPEMPKLEHISIEVVASVLLVAGGLLLLSLVPGMPGPRRMLKIVFGFFMLVAGLVAAIPGVPGPGLLIILGALAILAGEFVWARTLLHRFKAGAEQMKNAVWKSKPPSGGTPSGQGN
ncbi:MAG: PGPGW domain-containing protein [Verrucomicrobia bacterium]|nr:PGPGW domain-containing protein [Verrucomicrobiota bacterium]